MINSQLHTLRVDGNTLSYMTCGDPAAPPLVLIHGWLGARADWRLLLPELSRTHYCLTVDLLGHGDSDKPRGGDYGIPAQAHRVLAIADAAGLTQFALCGHSMGGMIGLTLAAAVAPERIIRMANLSGVVNVQSLVLKSTAWLAPRAEFLVDWGFALARKIAPFKWGARILGSQLFYRHHPPEFCTINLPYAIQPGIEVPFYKALEAILAMDLVPLLPDIVCPVLTIFGKQDRLVPPGQGRLVDARVNHHQLLLIEACGHYLMLEKPGGCLVALHDFLTEDPQAKGRK